MTVSDTCTERIRERLESALKPDRIDIRDDGHRHIGHAGARRGGHFTVVVVSSTFHGKGPLERHRLVYAALGGLMQTEIHALSVQALTPHEAQHNSLA